MKLRIENIQHHRNGISGAPFQVLIFRDPEAGRMLGIVTVDDIIDALVSEQTEDVQKLGGMEAIDEPYLQISFREMLRKRAGWLAILFVGETLTAHEEDRQPAGALA